MIFSGVSNKNQNGFLNDSGQSQKKQLSRRSTT